jgi:regulator of replication initiation timing
MLLSMLKQLEVMDDLRLGYSVRETARRNHVSKTTVMEYKKNGPQFYRKFSRNPPLEMYPVSWPKERKWFIQALEEVQQRGKQYVLNKNEIDKINQHLIQERNQKDTEISNLKQNNAQLADENNALSMENQDLEQQIEQQKQTIQEKTQTEEKLKDKLHQTNQLLLSEKEENGRVQTELLQTQKALASLQNMSQLKHSDQPEQELQRTEEKPTIPWFEMIATGLLVGGASFLNAYFGLSSVTTVSGYSESANQTNIPALLPWPGAGSSAHEPSISGEYQVNLQDNVIQPDTQAMGPNVTLVTNPSTMPWSGTYSSSHLEKSGFTSNVKIIQGPSLYQPPINFYTPLFTPPPSELLRPGDTHRYTPITALTPDQFVTLTQWALEQLGCTVTPRPKTHDEGADLDAERFGVKYVIQIKHKKEHIGTHAVMEVLYAQREYQKKYGPTKAWIISSSPFVKGLQEKHPDVEFWDLERLLTELHKHGIYYPAE